jgi:membrane protease YdiL (CAAX protease family)
VAAFESASYLFYAWLSIALVLGVPVGILLSRAPSALLLPARRQAAVPWTGLDVILAFGVYFAWQFFLGALSNLIDAAPQDRLLQRLAVTAISVPAALVTILLFLKDARGARLYQFGLNLSHWRGNLVVAYLLWLILTPLILVINGAVDEFYVRYSGVEPKQHPLAELLQGTPTILEWVIVILQAVIAAPVIEELLFRAILQRWLSRHPEFVGAVFALAMSFALLPADSIDRKWSFGFVLAMSLCYFAIRPLGRTAGAAIYPGSLLFAAFHSAVWPTPVALFVLGLMLGYFAYRTQSLLGPITFHALFNGVSCLALALAPDHSALDEMNGKPTTAAVQRSSVASISTAVPISLCPLRK